ncbi:hypothetical protein GCM10022294_09000 [Dietzia aurantiaca]
MDWDGRPVAADGKSIPLPAAPSTTTVPIGWDTSDFTPRPLRTSSPHAADFFVAG